MNVSNVYKERYEEYRSFHDDHVDKYEWVANNVFDLTTYDSELDELFVKKIFEVLKVIFERKNFEYIKDKNNYVTYILVCQLLNQFHWIEWGTSIRGAWFDANHPNYDSKLILDQDIIITFVNGVREENIYPEVRCTEENLKALIKFVED